MHNVLREAAHGQTDRMTDRPIWSHNSALAEVTSDVAMANKRASTRRNSLPVFLHWRRRDFSLFLVDTPLELQLITQISLRWLYLNLSELFLSYKNMKEWELLFAL